MRLSQRKRKERINVGVLFSFVFSMLAVLSLSLYGIVNVQQSKVSYAAPTSVLDNDSFTFYVRPDVDLRVYQTSLADSFRVPMYYADSSYTIPVYCVEEQAPVDSNVTYNKDNSIVDYGLLYLLNNTAVNGVKVLPTGVSNAYTETAVTQLAIWMYQHEVGAENSTISDTDLNIIKNSQVIRYVENGTTEQNISVPNLYTTYIQPLVTKARSASSVKELEIVKENDDLVLNGDWYSTSLIGVNSNSDGFLSYDVSVNGIEGVRVVDAQGNEMTTTELPLDKKFKVLIPKASVTTTSQNLSIGVKGKFNGLDGKYYTGVSRTGSALQKVVTVTGNIVYVEKGTSIEVVGAPDTAKNAIQILYFIGLIILLSGVGIIYANAKPVQVKQ